MTISDIRIVLDTSNWTRSDLGGHTREEFIRRDVPQILLSQIEAVRALKIPGRFVRDIERRTHEIASCETLLDRWYSHQARAANLSTAEFFGLRPTPLPDPSADELVASIEGGFGMIESAAHDATKQDGTTNTDSKKPPFAARNGEVFQGSEWIASSKSATFAKRIANALNKHTPNDRGV